MDKVQKCVHFFFPYSCVSIYPLLQNTRIEINERNLHWNCGIEVCQSLRGRHNLPSVSNFLRDPYTAGKKAHRTPKNLYILNLGISGLSTCIICIPPTLTQCLYGGKWFLGLVACKLVPTMQGTNTLVSTGTITAIAIDRWFTITQGTTLNTTMSHNKVAIINLAIWLASFLFTFSLYLSRW